MNSVMEPKLNMAEGENEVSEVISEIGDQNVEPLEINKEVEKCASQPDLSIESLPTSPNIKSPVRTSSITNINSGDCANSLATTTRLTTSKLRPPTILTPKPLARKTSNLSTPPGMNSTSSNFLPKRFTPNSSIASSHESLKPVSIIKNSPRVTKKQLSIKFDLSPTKPTKSTTTSKIPVNQIKVNAPKLSVAKNKPTLQKAVHKRCDNGSEKVRNNVDCEKDSLELKNMQRRVNTVTNTCMKIVNKTYDNEDVLEIMKSIESNECEVEKLALVAQLFDICCKENKELKEQNKFLKEENNDLKTQVSDFSLKIEQFKQKQQMEIDESLTVESEILAREKTISELKLQLEDNIFELNSLKIENEEYNEILKQQEEELNIYKTNNKHTEAKLAEMQLKLNNYDTTFQNNEELQEQVDELEMRLMEKSTEFADTLHKAQQFFAEMLQLKEQVKDMSEEKVQLQAEVEKLQKLLQENKNKCMTEEQMKVTECAKSLEIDRLKVELFKARQIIQHLKEDNERYQQLLDLKTELKKSLEQTDDKQKNTLKQIKSKVVKKSISIQDLTEQIKQKSIDCQDIVKSLNEKQLLISQQQHEIRMLKEADRHSQFLRLKQEEKIAKLEDKINTLQKIL